MPKNNKKRGQRGPEEDEEVEKVLQDLANGEDSGTALGGGQQKGGKGGKKNRRNQAADEDEEVERILQAIANGEEVPEDSQPASNKKGGAKQQQQKKGRRGQRGPGEDDEEDGEDEPAPAKQQQQQKGGNKKGANKRNNRRGGDDDEDEEEPAPAPPKQQQQQQKGGKGKNNRRNRGAEDDEEVEKVLQDLAEGKEPASSPAPQPKQQQQQQQKGGKKNRRNQAADEDEEVEAILQAIAEGKEVPDTAAPKGGKKGQQQQKQQQKAAAEEEEEEADGGDDDAEGEGEGEGTKQLSAAAKKRLKKKQKEQEKKAQAAAAAAAPKGKAGAAGAKGKAGAAGKAAEAAPAAGGAAKKPRNAIAAMILKQQEEERKRKEEEERLIREEEERLRKEQEEEERLRKELEEKRAANRLKKKEKNKDAEKRRAERERQEKLARLGIAAPTGEDGAPKQKKPQSALYAKPKKQRQVVKTQEEQEAQKQQEQAAAAAAAEAAAAAKTEEPESWEEVDEWEQKAEEPAAGTAAAEPAAADEKKEEPKAEEPLASPTAADAEAKGKTADAEGAEAGEKKPALRSPICCILGHVDTGKTKLLDKIRQTNVQGGEAGGITQQIGASFFPLKALKEKTKAMAQKTKFQIKVPGLLVIDTPGHESFTNLRSRGSSLCDIAVLVVDLMHGLEPQTLESIKLLRQRKTPFIVALNKIDRIYGWKESPNAPFQETLKKQTNAAKQEFETRVAHTVTMFAEQGLNAVLYYQNKDFVHNVSLVPTSAHTGEGIPDMLALLIQLTQTKLTKRIVTKDLFQATVLEVKVVEGLGTTIDVILVNGVLHEGDRIVVCGLDGPIATNIRALLTPHPMRELRVKTPYQHHKQVVAAQGVKISAQGLDRAVAGSSLVVVGEKDDEELIMSRVQADLTDILKKVQKRGVCVQASTLGSLEALLTFLGESNIPVGSINIGPVHRADVIKASVNLDKGKRKEFGCILAFDVPVDKDAKAEAAKAGVRIFTADIIYHLFDQFTAYLEELKAKEKAEAALKVVFPCILEIVPGCVFNKKDPIVIGVRVVEGLLKLGTPLCVQKVVTTTDDEGRTRNRKEMLYIGKITSLQDNHKEVPQAVVDQQVAVKIEGGSVTFGRQLDESSKIYSQLSRESIDALKDHFRDVLVANKGMVALIQKLKPMFDIM